MIVDTLAEPPPNAPASAKPNCRRCSRTPHACEAWLSSPTATDPADRVEVTTLNISPHGVAFELPARIPTGAYYILRFTLGDRTLSREIRILSCKAADHSFRVGAEFC